MGVSGEQQKQIEAQCRAMPVSRMLDYGMRREQAEAAHRAVRAGVAWDIVLEQLAVEAEKRAVAIDTSEDTSASAREAWHGAAACLTFAQMAFNFDTPRKRALYGRMVHCYARFAALSRFPVSKLEIPFRHGRLFGWQVCPAGAPAAATVVVFGGMSGWSTSYRFMAEALCARGLECLLVDGPGQGESRLEGGIFADAAVTEGFGRFVDVAQRHASAPRRVGLWGNSFGGLFASLTAAADERVAACCINGAPARAQVPPFRTAQEQMAAMLGREDLASAGDILAALSYEPTRRPMRCPVLVLEGGADPLVPEGSQDIFLSDSRQPHSGKLEWADGEHTIYNHADERNALVADWFATVLR